MAKDLKEAANGGDQDETRKSNSKARQGVIRSVFRELRSLDKKIETVQAERRELLQTKVKGDLDMKIADFNLGYRLYKLEEDARDEMVDTLKEMFKALGKGDQLDFVTAFEQTGPRQNTEQTGAAA